MTLRAPLRSRPPRPPRRPAPVLALAALLVACGGEPPEATTDAAAPVISGRYEVQGVTTTPGTGSKRKIAGTVILEQNEDRYTATFELKTVYPTEGPPTPADVIGVGEGTVRGNTLEGEARTQLVMSAVPGIDTGFAFVPRSVSTRLVSDSVARIRADGSIQIELENRGADEAARYRPTHTRLLGQRVGDAGSPLVAAQR